MAIVEDQEPEARRLELLLAPGVPRGRTDLYEVFQRRRSFSAIYHRRI